MVQRLMLIPLAVMVLVVGWAVAQDRRHDEVTQQLFEQYIARQVKISTESVMAATHLVAERGRENGFWRIVLAELKRRDANSEIGCVRVLGKMLATDAAARDVIRRREETGEVSAWLATVCLSGEVVAELLERGRKADRFRIDHYTIAMGRARVPETRDFFKSILHATSERLNPFASSPKSDRDPPNTTTPHSEQVRGAETAPVSLYHLESTRFHAAVGLAQLGDMEGVNWLVDHCEFSQGTVMHARPAGTRPGGNLSDCCLEALRHLSGDHSRTTQAEWAEWSKSVEKKDLLRRAVTFGDF